MKVNRNSWHYKFYKFSKNPDGYQPENLCKYIRGLLGSVFFTLFLVIPLVVAALLSIVDFPVTAILYFISGDWEPYISKATAVIGGVIWALVLFTILLLIKEGLEMVLPTRTIKPPKPPKPPSLFRLWLRAKKEKICPLIELENDNEY